MSDVIWVLNHYAGAPGYGRGLRHYHLASNWGLAGADVTIFAARRHHLMGTDTPKAGLDSVSGVDYVWLDVPGYVGNGLKRLWNMVCFAWLLLFKPWHKTLKQSPTVVLISSPHLFAWLAGFFLARKHGARLVFEVRDIWPLSLVELAGASRWHPLVLLFNLLERLGYRYSDEVVSNLPYANEHMMSRGLPSGRFHWIPNGVCFEELSALTNDQHPLVRHLRKLRSENKFIVFYAGGHGAPNSLAQVVDAALILASVAPDVQFVMVGEGDEKTSIVARAKASKLSNINFFPGVSKSVVNAALPLVSAGLATVQNSPIYRYGVSLNKLFDYMGAAVPVLYVVPGRYNPVAESNCGVSVVPERPELLAAEIQALSQLSVIERSVLGRNGLNYVRKVHDYKVLAETYMKILQGE